MANFAERILNRLNETNVHESMRIAARDTIVAMRERIFDKGLNSKNQPIGKYSTRGLNISKDAMPRQVGGGHDDGTSVYFSGGYAEFKRKLGYTKVNWRLFGTLMRDFTTPKETVSGYSLKYSVKSDANQEKLDYLEDHFSDNGSTITLTDEERANLNKVFNFELEKRLFDNV